MYSKKPHAGCIIALCGYAIYVVSYTARVWYGFLATPICILLFIIAIILSAVSRKDADAKQLSTLGIVLGAIGIVVVLVFTFLVVIVLLVYPFNPSIVDGIFPFSLMVWE